MTVKLQALPIKSELKVTMRCKKFKAVAVRCINKSKPKARVTKYCVLSQNFVITVITKFLSRYLFLWRNELARSFLFFRLHKFLLKMITNFSKRRKLHLLLTSL